MFFGQPLFENFHLEGFETAYAMEDFQKDYVRERLSVLSTDELLKRFPTYDRLKGLSTDEILKRISLEEIQRYLEKQKKD